MVRLLARVAWLETSASACLSNCFTFFAFFFVSFFSVVALDGFDEKSLEKEEEQEDAGEEEDEEAGKNESCLKFKSISPTPVAASVARVVLNTKLRVLCRRVR